MDAFKICRSCGKIWESRDEFLKLDGLIPLGFQAHFLDGNKSILLFHHDAPNCQTTLAVPVMLFKDLIPGLMERETAFLTSECNGLCLTDNRLVSCGHPYCRNALIRQFAADLAARKKNSSTNEQRKE